MLGIRYSGCGWLPVRRFLCLFWRETHTKDLRMRSPMRPEEDEGRQGPRAVNRRRQSTEERSQREVTARQEARTCGLRGRVSQREKMSQRYRWLCGNFARIHAHESPQMHRKLHKSVTNFSLLALGANLSPCLFVLLFSPLSIVYVVSCVFIKKCEIPLPEMRETTRRSDGHEWFRKLR